MVGLDVENRKITNQSLRVTAMTVHVQEHLGFSDDTQLASPVTVTATLRHRGPTKELTWTGLPWFVGASQAFLTGVAVSVPDQSTVRVRLRRTGELRKPAPLLPFPYHHPTQEDTVELGLLPLSDKKYNIEVAIPDSITPFLQS